MSIPAAPSDWSDDLKAQTRDVIKGHGIFAMCDDQLCLKHVASGFGVIAVDDLARRVLRVVERRTGAETIFASANALVAAGWVID